MFHNRMDRGAARSRDTSCRRPPATQSPGRCVLLPQGGTPVWRGAENIGPRRGDPMIDQPKEGGEDVSRGPVLQVTGGGVTRWLRQLSACPVSIGVVGEALTKGAFRWVANQAICVGLTDDPVVMEEEKQSKKTRIEVRRYDTAQATSPACKLWTGQTFLECCRIK